VATDVVTEAFDVLRLLEEMLVDILAEDDLLCV
jgi:hypothetical protein